MFLTLNNYTCHILRKTTLIMSKKEDFRILREKAGLAVADLADLTGKTLKTVYRWENGESKPHDSILNLLENIVSKNRTKRKNQHSEFKFIDLFAGIGGMRKGFESIGGECVFTSEWNKFSRQTYLANFGCEHYVAGDITNIDERDIPKHDVLLAGFPCQPFSLAGVSKKNSLGKPHGFNCDIQGTLFFDVARILDHHRPAAFLLENVKNLVSHDKGNTFKTIRKTLDELGYKYDFRVIDAKHFLPQHRERIFIAGFREDPDFSFKNINLPDLASAPLLKSILHTQNGTEKAEPPFTVGEDSLIGDKYTLSEHLWSYLQAYAEKHRKKGNGFGFGLTDADGIARTLSARYHKDGSEILIRQEGKRPRRLTPRECSRLMGFDDFGKSDFIIPVSDTQAYRQFGNAVAVPVVKAVAQHMKPFILDIVKAKTEESEEVRIKEHQPQVAAVYG